MSENFKRPRRQKSTSKTSFIIPIICVLFLGAAMWTNSIATKYTSKITDLSHKLNSTITEGKEIEAKNKQIETSIEELDSQIEEIQNELN